MLRAQSTVLEACKAMRHTQSTAFVVVQNDESSKVVGIFSEQDVVRRVIAAGLSPGATTLSAVMTRQPKCLSESPKVEDEALSLMTTGNFRHVPVVHPTSQDFVRSVDVLQAASAAVGQHPSLADAMGRAAKKLLRLVASPVSEGDDAVNNPLQNVSRDVSQVELPATSTIFQACRAMTDRRLSAVLVRTRFGARGIVTESDIVRRVVADSLDVNRVILAEIMTPNPTSVVLETEPREALRLMLRKGWRHLPVRRGGGSENCAETHESNDFVAILDVLSLLRAAMGGVTSAPTSEPATEATTTSASDEAREASLAKLAQHRASAAAALARSDFPTALKHLEEATRDYPATMTEEDRLDFLRLRLRRGTVRSVVGDAEGALQDFEYVSLRASRFVRIDEQMKRAMIEESSAGQIEIHLEQGKLDGIPALLAKFERGSPSWLRVIQVSKNERRHLKDSGKSLFTKQLYADAVCAFDSALALVELFRGVDPTYIDAREWAILLTNRGACRQELGSIEAAVADWIKACEIDPTYEKAWLRRCADLQRRQQHAERARVAERARLAIHGVDAKLDAHLIEARQLLASQTQSKSTFLSVVQAEEEEDSELRQESTLLEEEEFLDAREEHTSTPVETVSDVDRIKALGQLMASSASAVEEDVDENADLNAIKSIGQLLAAASLQ